MESAAEWGERHKSCEDAMEQRRALGPDATQADWYRVCDRGDWLLWQLEWHPRWHEIRPVIQPVADRIVARAIRRGAKSLRGIRSKEATAYRRWARRWLSGENRSRDAAMDVRDSAWAAAWDAARDSAWAAARDSAWDSAWAAARDAAWDAARDARDAAWDAARAAELRRQAREIHAVIPEWPNEDG